MFLQLQKILFEWKEQAVEFLSQKIISACCHPSCKCFSPQSFMVKPLKLDHFSLGNFHPSLIFMHQISVSTTHQGFKGGSTWACSCTHACIRLGYMYLMPLLRLDQGNICNGIQTIFLSKKVLLRQPIVPGSSLMVSVMQSLKIASILRCTCVTRQISDKGKKTRI